MHQSSQPINPQEGIAISVQGLSKAYRIWRDPSARLKVPLWETIGSIVPKMLRPKALKNRLCHEGKSRYYTDFFALDHLNIEVKKGEAIGIIGRNGSGKSTLLQMVAGTLTPTTGEIQVNGRVAALLELGSGFNPDFTGRENIFLNASVLGLSEQQIADRLDAILEFADIGDFIDQPVKSYSSGMTMRLAFAVIAHVDADILIVDEALAVGDVFFVQKCMRFIRSFKETGTLLLVTHDTSAVQSICDRAVWLHQGYCKQVGTTKEVSEAYLEAAYAEKQGVSLFTQKDKSKHAPPAKRPERLIDQRTELINNSTLRNDLEAFRFNEDSSAFGANNARIDNVEILDRDSGHTLAYGIGGESVILRVTITAHKKLEMPVVGFILKNQLGQQIFGDNTYLTYVDSSLSIDSGKSFNAEFHFQMPALPAGDYAIAIAVATGTDKEHVQQHWMHDALVFKSNSSYLVSGVVGIPMNKICITNI